MWLSCLQAQAEENVWRSSWLPTLSLQHVVGILDFGFFWQRHCPAIQQFNHFGLHLFWDPISQVLKMWKKKKRKDRNSPHSSFFFFKNKAHTQNRSSVIYIKRCIIQDLRCDARRKKRSNISELTAKALWLSSAKERADTLLVSKCCYLKIIAIELPAPCSVL